jgi:subfamily B ATP-binding cassette protein MsbA
LEYPLTVWEQLYLPRLWDGWLSGQQWIALVRALLCRPKFLILDEPANPLNSLSEEFNQHALNQLHRHYTMVMIAQRLSTVTRAPWIILLNEGLVTEQGSQAEALAVGRLLAKLHDPENNELGPDVSETR